MNEYTAARFIPYLLSLYVILPVAECNSIVPAGVDEVFYDDTFDGSNVNGKFINVVSA